MVLALSTGSSLTSIDVSADRDDTGICEKVQLLSTKQNEATNGEVYCVWCASTENALRQSDYSAGGAAIGRSGGPVNRHYKA